MPVPPSLLKDPSVIGPLGSLALSQLRPQSAVLALRAVRWHAGLERLGVVLPFAVVHDVGLLFAVPREQVDIGPRCDMATLGGGRGPDLVTLTESYRNILAEIGESEAASKEAAEDERYLMVVVLSRLLGTGPPASPWRRRTAPPFPWILALESIDGPSSPHLFSPRAAPSSGRAGGHPVARLRADHERALDLVPCASRHARLRGQRRRLAQVDLLAALESPEANDIVNFSLEILPSVLETKTRPAAGTTAAFGYSGLGTRGSIDSMVLTELAWDDLELARRLVDNEVLYFAREQSRDEQRRVHYLLIDASASMRGDRQTFARGMAIATARSCS